MTERSSQQAGILVLGGGPAGGAVALGLRRLGYDVTLVAQPRAFLTVGGICEETVSRMKRAGFSFALRDLPEPCDKLISWNGSLRHHCERLINSNEVDRGILLDLRSAGITVIEGQVGKIHAFGSGYQVDIIADGKTRVLAASFLVEARGRAAPGAGLVQDRGAQTLMLQYYWQDQPCRPGAVLQSFPQGVAWLATWFDGSRYLNLMMDAEELSVRDKPAMRQQGRQALAWLEHILPMCPSQLDSCTMHARSGTASLTREAIADNWIRVGDAALAVDGIIDSSIADTLETVAVVPAVINTLLQKPANAGHAKEYYQHWLAHRFYRQNRKNHHLFNQEQSWAMQPFWYKRQRWPDAWPEMVLDDESQLDLSRAELQVRPALVGHYIELEEVVITETQPMGVQSLNGVSLVEIVKSLQSAPGQHSVSDDTVAAEHRRYLSLWLKHRTA